MPKKAEEKIFKQGMTDIGTLDDVSKRKVLAYLKKHISSDGLTVEGFIKDLRDKRFRKGFACPHCNSEEVTNIARALHRYQKYRTRSILNEFIVPTSAPSHRRL